MSLRGRHRLGVTLLVMSVLTSYICAIPFTAHLFNAHLQSHRPLTRQVLQEGKPAAIVVLAGGLYQEAPEYGGDTVHLRTLGRVRYAARLARQTGLPILASGGYAYKGGLPEGDIMGRLLEEEYQVSPVWVENTSRNTWENALHSAAILQARGIETIVLVTHAFHIPRAMEVFQRFGLRVIPAPTLFFPDELQVADIYSWLPSAAAVRQINYALHEIIGRVWYRLMTRTACGGTMAETLRCTRLFISGPLRARPLIDFHAGQITLTTAATSGVCRQFAYPALTLPHRQHTS